MEGTDSMQHKGAGLRRGPDLGSVEERSFSHRGGFASLWGAATARQRLLPDVIVMGDPGGAMSLLLRLLDAHPQSFGCREADGSGFFDDGYSRGIRWYAAHFPTRWSATLRADGADPHAFEWGAYYLSHPLAAERIARCLPDASVVVLLEDPVERAVAAHRRAVMHGVEWLEFEDALDWEEMRLLGETDRLVAVPGSISVHHRHHAYVSQGRYAEHLGRLRFLLGEERVHVIDAVRFAAEPRLGFQKLLDRLGWVGVADSMPTPEALPPAGLQHQLAAPLRARLRAAFAESDEQLAGWLEEPLMWREAK